AERGAEFRPYRAHEIRAPGLALVRIGEPQITQRRGVRARQWTERTAHRRAEGRSACELHGPERAEIGVESRRLEPLAERDVSRDGHQRIRARSGASSASMAASFSKRAPTFNTPACARHRASSRA